MFNFWKEKRVFITGGSGFIGSWLVKKLVDLKASVIVLVKDKAEESGLLTSPICKKVRFIDGELEDFRLLDQTLRDYEIETVFHLGAQTQVGNALLKPLDTFESNIRGTYHLLEACRRHKIVKRIVIASSDKAYGESQKLPYTEDMPLKGMFPYDVSKTCTDLLASSYFHTYQLPIAIARCGNVFGGGDFNWSRLIPGSIKKLYHHEHPILRSDGSCLRDYIYVGDVVDAYLLLAERLNTSHIQGEAFNFSLSQPESVLSIVNKLLSLMDKKELSPRIHNVAEAEIQDQFLSCKKAKQILGWSPRFDLETGLKATIQWYQNYFLEKQLKEMTASSSERLSEV